MKKMSLADAILKRKKKKNGDDMLEDNYHESANIADKLNFKALRKPIYREDEALDELEQPEDSNLLGDDLEDEDEHGRDMISRIRRRMRSKRME